MMLRRCAAVVVVSSAVLIASAQAEGEEEDAGYTSSAVRVAWFCVVGWVFKCRYAEKEGCALWSWLALVVAC